MREVGVVEGPCHVLRHWCGGARAKQLRCSWRWCSNSFWRAGHAFKPMILDSAAGDVGPQHGAERRLQGRHLGTMFERLLNVQMVARRTSRPGLLNCGCRCTPASRAALKTDMRTHALDICLPASHRRGCTSCLPQPADGAPPTQAAPPTRLVGRAGGQRWDVGKWGRTAGGCSQWTGGRSAAELKMLLDIRRAAGLASPFWQRRRSGGAVGAGQSLMLRGGQKQPQAHFSR